MMLSPGVRVHIIGIGGAGMSALARLLQGYGCVVSGSDASESPVLDALGREGITIAVGASPAHVAHVDVVTWSPAVASDHVEIRTAASQGTTLWSRARMMEELSRLFDVIGVAGTHGKTTATSMLVHIDAASGRQSSRLVGTAVPGVGENAAYGSRTLLCEVDESYGTFTAMSPVALAVLNIDADHLDYYGDLTHLEDAFASLCTRTSGPVVVWSDDLGVARATAHLERPLIRVGEHSGEWRVRNVELRRRAASFKLVGDGESVFITLHVTGHHNVIDAAVTATLALVTGHSPSAVTTGLATFQGAPRRFEYLGTFRGVDVVIDYAHMPAEIGAALAGARDAGYQHIVCVFQPHRYTRTQRVGADFAPAFTGAAKVILTDIYGAGEVNDDAVGTDVIDEALVRQGTPTHTVGPLDEAAHAVITALETQSDVDLVLLVGAGNVGDVWSLLTGRSDELA